MEIDYKNIKKVTVDRETYLCELNRDNKAKTITLSKALKGTDIRSYITTCAINELLEITITGNGRMVSVQELNVEEKEQFIVYLRGWNMCEKRTLTELINNRFEEEYK